MVRCGSLAQSKNAAALAGGRGRVQRTFLQCRCTITAPEVTPASSGSGGIQSRLAGSSTTVSDSLARSPHNAHPKTPVAPQCRAAAPSASTFPKGWRLRVHSGPTGSRSPAPPPPLSCPIRVLHGECRRPRRRGCHHVDAHGECLWFRRVKGTAFHFA